MSFVITKLKSSGGLDALREEQIASYCRRGAALMAEHFAPICAELSAETREQIALRSFRAATSRGITSEKGHLSYLVVRMYWGDGFEANPLYQPGLLEANWIFEDGQKTRNIDVGPLLDVVTTWEERRAQDLADYGEWVDALERIYANDLAPDQVHYAFVRDSLVRCWPALMASNPPEVIQSYANAVHARAGAVGLRGLDAVLYACLGVQFGLDFGTDPLYPWTGDMKGQLDAETLLSGTTTYFEHLFTHAQKGD